MSLIDEALKRARMEAAQRAAEGEGLPYPSIPRHLGPPRRAGWLVPLAVILAVVAGVAVGLLMASRNPVDGRRVAERGLRAGSPTAASGAAADRASSPPPTATDPSPASRTAQLEPAAAAPETPPEAGPPATESARAAPPQTRARPESRPADQRTSPPAEIPQPPAPKPAMAPRRPAADPAPMQASEPGAEPAAKAPQAAQQRTTAVTDAESGVLLVLPERFDPEPGGAAAEPGPGPAREAFTQRLPLPDGSAIELGGIAWSETGPFALINGRVVGPGATIEGYVLERIRPGHVLLAGDGRRIQLSLQ